MKTMTCRVSGKPLIPVIDLGELHVSGFYPTPHCAAPRAPLRLGIGEESGLLQLMDSIERAPLYKTYWYRSGTNSTMKRQLVDVVDNVLQWIRLNDGDVVLDIGCNDGTLLSCYPSNYNLIKAGIDPAENLAQEARRLCTHHATGFFTRDTFMSLTGGRKAKIITSIAMFYGLEDPMRFVADIMECLDDDGVWVLQLSYTPLMIIQNAFDNICHEHIEYYTLLSLLYLLKKFDLRPIDVQFNDTNAGSFRVIIVKSCNSLRNVPLFQRDIGKYRVESTVNYEKSQRLDDPDLYRDYMLRLLSLKQSTLQLITDLHKSGKRIMAYGASTKGNTLLQFYGLGPDLIEAIAERQPTKYGLYTAGTWIPIISEDEMRKRMPDYLLVLPWHFINEFMDREREFVRSGGQFIIPLPQLQVV